MVYGVMCVNMIVMWVNPEDTCIPGCKTTYLPSEAAAQPFLLGAISAVLTIV